MKVLGGRATKVAGLHKNYAGKVTPNGCSQTRERQAVFAAARKFIDITINPFTCYTDTCLQDTVPAVGGYSEKLMLWIP